MKRLNVALFLGLYLAGGVLAAETRPFPIESVDNCNPTHFKYLPYEQPLYLILIDLVKLANS